MTIRVHRNDREAGPCGWRRGENVREICACQAHARRQRGWWRRAWQWAQGSPARARGIALLLGVPLALSAWTPIDSMGELAVATKKTTSAAPHTPSYGFPVFDTEHLRRTLLSPQQAEPSVLTHEATKEAFFRTQVPYGSIIYREARRNHLDPELVAAVVKSESDFRPGLASDKNARGLMQIVPATGRLMGAANLYDPQQNIAAGTKYLRYLFDRFGNERMVLAAYNAGEGNILRFRGVPPFPETMSYVARVAQRQREYTESVRRLYDVGSGRRRAAR